MSKKKPKKSPSSAPPAPKQSAEFLELAPLTDAEVNELADFLASRRVGRNCMPLDALHGFITALLIGPETIMPSVWIPQVWGPSDDDEPDWKNDAEFHRIVQLILSLCNEIAELLELDIERFEPWLMEGDFKGQPYRAGEVWAAAFMRGTQFWGHHLETLRARPEGKALVPITSLARATFWVTPAGYFKGIMKRQTYVAQLPASVATLHAYFIPIRIKIVEAHEAMTNAGAGTGRPN